MSDVAVGRTRPRTQDVAARSFLATGAAFLAWAVAASEMRMDPADPSVTQLLHPLYVASIVIVATAFVAALLYAPRPWLLGLQTVVLAAFLHLTPFLVQGVARFRTNWRNFGYSEFFERHAHGNPDLIWYHNWPAFFIEGHHLADALGGPSDSLLGAPNVVLGAFPFMMAVLIAGAAAAMFSVMFRGDVARAFAATWIVLAANWINQELFGPQPLAFAAFLMLIGLMVDEARGTGRVGGSSVVRRGLVALLYMAIVVVHPLTAVFFVGGLAVLSIFRPRERRLVAVSSLIFVVWLAFGAYSYLILKLGGYVSEIGNVALIMSRGFGHSFDASPESALVGRMRTIYSGILVIAGVLAIAATRAWRQRDQRAPLVWAALPFGFLGAFSYDGEIYLRVFMFSLPFLAYFMVKAATEPLPSVRGVRLPRRRAYALLASTLVLTAAAHPALHYGEDAVEFVHAREIVGVETFYALAVEDSRVLPVTCCIVAEVVARDKVGMVSWWGFLEWDGNRLDWSHADEVVDREPYYGPQYVWLGDSDRQELEFRQNDPDGHARLQERLDGTYPHVYDSGGLRVYFVPPTDLSQEERA